jgi:parvulin-like peptidyl-prolyl isomerase
VRRVAAVGVAVAAVLVGGACSAVPDADAAATVGDHDITVDSFEHLLRAVTDNEELFGIPADLDTDSVQAAQGRSVLDLLVQSEVTRQYLDASGESITDEDRQAVRDQLGEDHPVFDLPDDVVSVLVDSQAGPTAVARVAPASDEELQRLYEESPEELGIVCVRHVQVASEAEAQAVLDELAAGASIEDLAVERSTEQGAAASGGALQAAADVDCAPESGVRERFGDEFADAALASRPGSPSEPVQTSFGWHVIEAQPHDAIAESLATVYEQVGPQLRLLAFADDAGVRVDPRYGRWDPQTGSVSAL